MIIKRNNFMLMVNKRMFLVVVSFNDNHVYKAY